MRDCRFERVDPYLDPDLRHIAREVAPWNPFVRFEVFEGIREMHLGDREQDVVLGIVRDLSALQVARHVFQALAGGLRVDQRVASQQLDA